MIIPFNKVLKKRMLFLKSLYHFHVIREIIIVFFLLVSIGNILLFGIICLSLLHFSRNDRQFCQIVYATHFKKIWFAEYMLLYAVLLCLFLLFASFHLVKIDTLFYFISILFPIFLILLIQMKIEIQKKFSFFSFGILASSQNYEWKAGLRKYGTHFFVYNIIFIAAIIVSKCVYKDDILLLYNIFLGIIMLYVYKFYIEREPNIFLEWRGKTKKEIILNTYKLHWISFNKIIFPATLTQSIMFFYDIKILVSLFTLLSLYLLLFFFIVDKYRLFEVQGLGVLNKLKYSLIVLFSCFLPFIPWFLGIISYIWFFNINKNDRI